MTAGLGETKAVKKIEHITKRILIRIVNMMADFDPVLSKLLNNDNFKTKYLCWKIQNEVINLLAL